MSSPVAKISELIPREELYVKKIYVQVIDISHHGWTSSDNIKFVVEDETGYLRVTLFSKKHLQKLAVNKFILVNNYSVTEFGITLRENSIIMHSKPFEIDAKTIEGAHLALYTPIKQMVTCSDLKKSPVKSILTVKGVVVSEDQIKNLEIRNKPCSVKEIKIKDSTDTIRCSLWRSATTSTLKVGQSVTFMDSNVTYNSFHKCNILNVNDIQSIMIEEETQGNKNFKIIAVDDIKEDIIELYVEISKEEKVMKISKNLFLKTFGFDEFSVLDDVIEQLPFECCGTFNADQITEIVESD